MKIYIAVWKDGHTDDWIELFKDKKQAQNWIDERKESYKGYFSDGSTYKWIDSKDPEPEAPDVIKWFGYVWNSSYIRWVVAESDDGPSGRIEERQTT